MLRPARSAALLVALLTSVLVLAACGGGDDKSDDSAAYKTQAKAVVLSIRATGDKLGDVLRNADETTDAELTQQLQSVQDLVTSDLADVTALKPPDDTAEKLVANLKTAYTRVHVDVGRLTDAATANDPTGAKSAAEQLVKDSPAVKAANNALGLSVGVAPRAEPATTATTATTETTATPEDTTTQAQAPPAGDTASFNTDATVVVNRIAHLGDRVEKIIKGADQQDDAALAQQLADAEAEARAAIKALASLAPPTEEYQKLVADLGESMQAIDADLASLSSAVGAHDVEASKEGTRKLLKDAPTVAEANTALADSLRTS